MHLRSSGRCWRRRRSIRRRNGRRRGRRLASRNGGWSGRIFDPNSGSTYDSTIALKGTDSLRVQGCAFGGMFCGGQTWTRVN